VNIPVASTESETSQNDLRQILGVKPHLDGASAKIPDNAARGKAGWKPGWDGLAVKELGG
jgi:hypothetical protein